MKEFLEVLTNARIVIAEIGGTLGLFFLMFYGGYKAWKEFVEKPLRSCSRRAGRPPFPPRDGR
jgi:hypothetical protein